MVKPNYPQPLSILFGLVVLVALSSVAQGEPADQATSPEITKYCTNIAAAAADARFAWQTNKLNDLEGRIKARIQDLDAKETELRGWIEKREVMVKQANEKLVGIYSKMRPETAASQISTLDDDMAATVLAQLGPRQASAIFNEIASDRAAKLAALIASGPPGSDKTEKPPMVKPPGDQSAANDGAPAGDKKP